MIEGLGLRNFKAFKEHNYLPFKKMNIFIGPNSSGKSSFLKGLLLLNETIKSKEEEPAVFLNEEMGNFESLVYGGQEKEKIGFEIKLSTSTQVTDTEVQRLKERNPNLYLWAYLASKRFADNNVENFSIKVLGEFTSSVVNQYVHNPLKSVEFQIKQTEKRPNVVHDFVLSFLNGDQYVIEMNRNSYYLKKDQYIFSQANLFQPAKFLFKVNEEKFQKSDPQELEDILLVNMALAAIERQLDQFFYSFSRIEPFRYRPERTELIANFKYSTVGSDGRNTISAVIGMKLNEAEQHTKTLQQNVNKWLDEFELAQSIDAEELKNNQYSLIVKNKHTGIESNIVDVGVGTSQLLPIILESFLTPKKSVLVIEEPETHIHPSAQAKLASMFAQCIKEDDKRFFIETHSMYFLQKIQIMVAKKELSPEDIGVYYFNQNQDGTTVKELSLGDNGQFIEAFPKGFFDVAYELSKQFMDAMMEGNQS